jgi:hypothetical protein
MQMAIGSYEECLKNAKKYQQSPLADKRYLPKIERMVQNCLFAIKSKKTPVNFKPINLGETINTELPEYFPSVTADDSTLLFTRRVDDITAPMGDKKIFLFPEKLINNHWSNSELISNVINSKYNEGAPTFSSDGQYIIFVGCEIGEKDANGLYQYGVG